MSGLCTKSWLLRSLLLHHAHRGQRLGRVFTAAEVSRAGEAKGAGQNPASQGAGRYSASSFGTRHSPLLSDFSSTLAGGENVGRETRETVTAKNPQECFWEEEGGGQQCHRLGTLAADVFVPSKKNLVPLTDTRTHATALLLPCTFVHPPSPPRSSPQFWSWSQWCGQWWKFWCRTGPRPGGSPRGVWRLQPPPPSWAWHWHLREAGRKQSWKSLAVPWAELAQHRAATGEGEGPAAASAAARPPGTARSPAPKLGAARRGRELGGGGGRWGSGRAAPAIASPAARLAALRAAPRRRRALLPAQLCRVPAPRGTAQRSAAPAQPAAPCPSPAGRSPPPACPAPHPAPWAARRNSRCSSFSRCRRSWAWRGGRCRRRRGRGAAARSRLRHLVSWADRGGGWESGSHPPAPHPFPRARTAPPHSRPPASEGPPPARPSIHHPPPARLAPCQLRPGAGQEGQPDCHLSHSWAGRWGLAEGPQRRVGQVEPRRCPPQPGRGTAVRAPSLPGHSPPRLAACAPTRVPPALLTWASARAHSPSQGRRRHCLLSRVCPFEKGQAQGQGGRQRLRRSPAAATRSCTSRGTLAAGGDTAAAAAAAQRVFLLEQDERSPWQPQAFTKLFHTYLKKHQSATDLRAALCLPDVPQLFLAFLLWIPQFQVSDARLKFLTAADLSTWLRGTEFDGLRHMEFFCCCRA